jgi:hypothetical protein
MTPRRGHDLCLHVAKDLVRTKNRHSMRMHGCLVLDCVFCIPGQQHQLRVGRGSVLAAYACLSVRLSVGRSVCLSLDDSGMQRSDAGLCAPKSGPAKSQQPCDQLIRHPSTFPHIRLRCIQRKSRTNAYLAHNIHHQEQMRMWCGTLKGGRGNL